MATNPMQRKARISFLLGMVVMLLISGIVIAFLFMQLSDFQNKEKENKKQSVQVYVLNQDVSSGQVITTDMFVMQTVNRNLVPSNATSDLSVIENYALQDKEGNDVYTKTDNNKNTSLYIRRNNREYELKVEDETDNYYIEVNDEKEYVELNNVPLIAKVDMKVNTVITKDLINKSDNVITDDVRKQEYNVFVLPMDLMTGDYIDVRLMLPSGQDYIVVAKKEVEVPNIAGVDSLDTIWINLGEDEILSLSSAIVDAGRINGSKLYVTKYAEAGMQEAATPTYVASAETATLINRDPNIVERAKEALIERYRNVDSTDIRNNYLNKEVEKAGEDGDLRQQTQMQESIQNSQDARKEYLDSLSGVVE